MQDTVTDYLLKNNILNTRHSNSLLLRNISSSRHSNTLFTAQDNLFCNIFAELYFEPFSAAATLSFVCCFLLFPPFLFFLTWQSVTRTRTITVTIKWLGQQKVFCFYFPAYASLASSAPTTIFSGACLQKINHFLERVRRIEVDVWKFHNFLIFPNFVKFF